MVNPVLYIGAGALLLSVLVITLLNRPKIPLVTGTLILILLFFVLTSFFVDNSLGAVAVGEDVNFFVCFAVLNDKPGYEYLEQSFRFFMQTDIVLFILCPLSLFAEALRILRKNSER